MNDQSQIQLHTRPVFPPPGAAPQLPQVVNIGGQLYQAVPVKPQADALPQGSLVVLWCVGMSLGFCVVGVGGLLVRSSTAPAAAPVVIEKPVAVPTTVKPHCIAFCGSDN